MTPVELPRYLANILWINAADGALNPLQESLFASVSHNLGVQPEHLAQTKELLRNDNYMLTAAVSYSQRLQNLEDILLIAAAPVGLAQALCKKNIGNS